MRRPYDVAAGLAQSYVFQGLTTEELEPLVPVVTTRLLVRGETASLTTCSSTARTLLRVGGTADEIYVVLSGEVKDSVVDAAGNEVVHFLHGPVA